MAMTCGESSRYSDPLPDIELSRLHSADDDTKPATHVPGLDGEYNQEHSPAVDIPQAPAVGIPLNPPPEQREGHDVVEPEQQEPARVVREFDFNSYGWPMSFGITSTLLYNYSILFPRSTNGLVAASYMFHFINITSFTIIFLINVSRFIRWPGNFSIVVTNPRQAALVGMLPMALGTIITMSMKLMAEDRITIIVLAVFWCIEVLLSIGVQFSASLLLCFSAAAVGSDVAGKLDADFSISIIWFCYTILALGVLHAIVASFVELYRLAKLVAHSRLKVENIVDIFMPPIAIAYIGTAAQQLGGVALRSSHMFPLLWEGKESLVSKLSDLGELCAFVCWAFAAIWQLCAFVIFLPLAIKMLMRGSFNPNWLVFPSALGIFASSSFNVYPQESIRSIEICGTVVGSLALALYHIFSAKAYLHRKGWANDQAQLSTAPEFRDSYVPIPWYRWLRSIPRIIWDSVVSR
ncbi:hypothetical protein F4859DRAFT_524300 [Xylaria cf. heliscus]|nr:hypothetical protein F4859DRAFT_524300 [Xylaria cf. heliscus]